MNKLQIERLMKFSRDAAESKRTAVGGSDQRLVLLCAWCKHEGRITPAANPERTHVNGWYQEEPLCDECANWLEQQQNNTLSDRASWITVMIVMPWTCVAVIFAKLLGAY